ncbi:MAG: NAD-dependent malic enzyme [Woeseiaceae bacterium]|nr:NAD-dependent malic enzyme [Woeseiaceae bacterium]
METFKLERSPSGDRLFVNKSGPELLRYPLCNKGMGFTPEERRTFGIEGLLPSGFDSIEKQAERLHASIIYNTDPVGRYIDLSQLQNRNEVLFYKILSMHLEELMPVVYTPTVGAASHFFSHVYRRGRGIFISPLHKGRIEEVLRESAPYDDVRLMVVTDNEAILGIGDQGVGGMAISIGKLALYTVGAGIHPAQTLPVSLDVGTNNQGLIADPWYLGYRHPRLRGEEYLELVDEFVEAVKNVFPRALVQWEDFRKDNALNILARHHKSLPSFNDDIQGTGAVTAAAVYAACRISDTHFRDHKFIVHGAGAAGMGIAKRIRDHLRDEGLNDAEVRCSVLSTDSRGVIFDGRGHMEDYKKKLALPADLVAEWGLQPEELRDLEKVVKAFRATVLIGTSGQPGSFTEEVVRSMAANTEMPVILPMSNPTTKCEAIPENILKWTDGKALVSTGSPFNPVEIDGRKQRIGQANNVFIFPGLGLGAIVSGASRVTDNMIGVSATALAETLSLGDLDHNCLMPEVSHLWDICGHVGLAVARQAVADGVADVSEDELEERVEAYRWKPRYPEIVGE